MASPTSLTASPDSVRNWNDDNSRVKILCSFNGSILPRPQDGKLRYVGGETRILSVPMDIGFVELMARMKELFEEARILKYKQPDEDLDALVSVVNDDDVINMMEEYDKLGSGTSDGFTRLRVFLFSNSEIDAPLHFLDAHGRDNERRYVDALNTFNDSPEFVKQPISEFQVMTPVDDVPLTEQYFNQLNLEGVIHNPRNVETPMTSVNLHHLTIPHLDPSRNPAYYSPRHPANDVPSSPSCSCYYAPYGEPVDRIYDKVSSEDYFGHNVNHLSPVDHQHLLPENVTWLELSSISGEQIGYPNNILNGRNMFEGNSVCEECSPPFPHSFYIRDPNDSRTFYNEAQPHIAIGPAAYLDSNHIPLPYVHDRSYYIRHMREFGSELFHEQPLARYKNYRYVYGLENLHYASSNGHVPVNSFSRDVQSPIQGSPSSETSISPQQQIVTSNFFKNPLVDITPKLADSNEVDVPDCYHVRALKLMPNSYLLEDHHLPSESSQSTTNMINCSNPHDSMVGLVQSPNLSDCKALPLNTKNKEIIQNADSPESLVKVGTKYVSERNLLHGETNFVPHSLEKEDLIVERLSYIPQVVESVKNAALEYGEEVKDEAQKGVDSATENLADVKEETTHELDVEDAPVDLELDSDTGTESNSKIEPTKAEEEAIAKGLQTIKNDDLEEVHQLGSGAYGSVYHGKWKGSDVAIKRIKASCFTGSPTERQRMVNGSRENNRHLLGHYSGSVLNQQKIIADFWKEALMLSSLHHPNVVSFYGIVRDGPDGSLATVTEYMVNGSLKQFLKKKDRTIDRRKRLIIAMDTAFGMEYLHGRNIVHFDLKCENLLVNMRDPHRPICKIGDLGLSKAKQQTMVSGGVRGTLPWMAPELLSGISHMVTDKIDVYSFGVVMWELLTGDEPYTNMHCASIIGGIVNNTLRPTIPTWCDPEWKSLMESCWSGDPQERPPFLEISHKLRTMAATIKVK